MNLREMKRTIELNVQGNSYNKQLLLIESLKTYA
jgi:hypothetical protein